MNSIATQKALRDYSSKLYLRPKFSLRRIWIQILMAYTAWEIGNSDNFMYRKNAEVEAIKDDIAAELAERVKNVDRQRKLRASL